MVPLALAVGTVLFSLVVFELPAWLGAVDYRNLFQTASLIPWRGLGVIQDPELLYVRRPYEHLTGTAHGGNITYLYRIRDPQVYRYDARYDRSGFRNEEDFTQADIAVLGDSFVEAMEIAHDQLLTTRLAQLQRTSVAGLGLAGYGPQQQLVLLRRYAGPLKPKVVVWMFYEGNDLKNLTEYQQAVAHWTEAVRSVNSFSERSFSYNALRLVGRRLQLFKPPGDLRAGVFSDVEGTTSKVYFLDYATELIREELDALDQTGRILAEAHEYCAQRGIDLTMVFIPIKFRVYGGLCHFADISECRRWVVNDMPHRMRALLGGISGQNRLSGSDAWPGRSRKAATSPVSSRRHALVPCRPRGSRKTVEPAPRPPDGLAHLA